MNHEESKLQQQCVAWFRAQYPQYAMLLTHVANEGNGNRVTGAIHKAEGTVEGVPDLLLFMPAEYKEHSKGLNMTMIHHYYALGIELKTPKGKQSQSQKDYQKMFETASYRYEVVRSFDTFRNVVNEYIGNVRDWRRKMIASAHVEIEQASMEREREKFKKMISKK